MLVLTRDTTKADEALSQIIIRGMDGTEIVVTAVGIAKGNKCRIGIQAPREWSVHRGEIQRMIDSEHN